MFGRIALFFTVVTLVELAILIPLGNAIGLLWTLGIIVLTALVGAWVVQREGARALRRISDDLNAGRLPADALIDGLGVLVAGALLATPGVLSDVFGLLVMTRLLRGPIRRIVRARFQRWLASGTSVGWMSNAQFGETIGFGGPAAGGRGPGSRAGGDVFDVDAAPVESAKGPGAAGEADARHGASTGGDPAAGAAARRGGPDHPTADAAPVYRDGDVIVVSRGSGREDA